MSFKSKFYNFHYLHFLLIVFAFLTVIASVVLTKRSMLFTHNNVLTGWQTLAALRYPIFTGLAFCILFQKRHTMFTWKAVLTLYLEILSIFIPAMLLSFALDVRTISPKNFVESIVPFFSPHNIWITGLVITILALPLVKFLLPEFIKLHAGMFLYTISGVLIILSIWLIHHPTLVALLWLAFSFLIATVDQNPFQNNLFFEGGITLFVITVGIGLFTNIPYRLNIVSNLAPFFLLLVLSKFESQQSPHMTESSPHLSYVLVGLFPILLILNNQLLLTLAKNFFQAYYVPGKIGSLLCFVIFFVVAILLLGYGNAVGMMVQKLHLKQRSILGALPLSISSILSVYILYNFSEFQSLGFDAMVKQQDGRIYLAFLNLLIIALWYLILAGIVNRFWISTVLFSCFIVAFSFANAQKIQYRNEPVIYPDMAMVKSLPDIVQMVNVRTVILLAVAIVAVLILAFYLQKKLLKGRIFKLVPRIVIIGISATILWQFAIVENQMNLSVWLNKKPDQKNPIAQMLTIAGYTAHPENLGHNAQAYGPALIFTSTEIVKTMDKPSHYSQATVKRVTKKYQRLADQINRTRHHNDLNKQTVIYILSESFANPDRVPSVRLSSNPIPYTDEIMKQNTSGLMYSPGYGGGTANIEFEALTGLSMNNFDPSLVTPYVFLVPRVNHLPVVTDLFAHKNAIHPYESSTYDRAKVFKKFGFQTFYTLDHHNIQYTKKIDKSRYVSDQSAYNQTLKQIQSVKGGQFIQLSTMQNHMPYTKGTYAQNNYTVSANLSQNSINQIESYTQGIHYSDQALKNFIAKISKMKQHVTIVSYGDHLPGIYSGSAVSGKNTASADAKLHQTDYFIYSNFKTHGVSNTKVVSPNMFTPMLLEQLNEKVSPYYALLTEVQKDVPAAERNKFMGANGQYISKNKLSKRAKKTLSDYKMIQYDITAGKQYALKHKKFVTLP
ncbi:LTA synthase family protein [Pediococcus cellicola]|uniref:Sulfatase N-terminal domain-containing protein n=1 Tax=Pediococcus cellicola TaxID=319652 RepID=A0A0R2IJP2_9LACO|nr:alkaline phosphatase family protein [Pediococcus cellicola]KRN65241.1 hypothetical protein IV80_GL000450 [Pediococcus cellicola]GEL15378.1 hypothetical protein PCE01_11800 [Pediococcus cellicola]